MAKYGVNKARYQSVFSRILGLGETGQRRNPAWCEVDCRIGILPGWKVVDAQAEIVACVAKAAKAHLFLAGLDVYNTGLTDTRFYGLDYGIPAFCFGAKAEGMHGFNERVSLESVKKVTKTLALFVAGWCGVEAAAA